MSESRETYLVHEALTEELCTLLTSRQVAMLVSLLRTVRKQGHGEITLRINGKRLYFSKKESFDAGQLSDLPD